MRIEESLNIFEAALESRLRLPTLLKDPQSFGGEGWFIGLPRGFSDALDIKWDKKLKEWRQGSLFAFSEGDRLYNHPSAYTKWSEALESFSLAIEVISAAPAGRGETGQYFPGRVEFETSTPDKEGKRLQSLGKHTMSQVDFVRMLISGPDEHFAEELRQLTGTVFEF